MGGWSTVILPLVGTVVLGAWAGTTIRAFAGAAATTDVGLEYYRAVPFQEKLSVLTRLPSGGAALIGALVTGAITLALAGIGSNWRLGGMGPWLRRSFLAWLPLAGLGLLQFLHGGLSEMATRRLAVGMGGAALVGAWGLQLVLVGKGAIWRRLVSDRRWRLLGVAAFAFLLPLTLWASAVQWPTGDEPHYLLVVESLLRDGDLDIRNNHSLGDYRFFYPGHIAHAHALEGTDGRWFSKHSPGLPLLSVPFYALAGRWGVVLLMTALASVLSVSLLRLALHAGASEERMVHIGWYVTFSVPLIAYANQVFPAVIVAIAVSEGCRLWIQPRTSRTSAALVLVGLGLVPWFHLGSAQLSVPFLMVLCVRIVRRGKHSPWLCVPPLLASALLIPFYCATLGRFLPAVGSYGTYRFGQSPLVLLRLFVDQEHGILIHAPFWVGAVWGAVRALRTKDWLLPSLVGTAYVALLACYSWWYGGWAPPARFLLPALPVALVPLALSGRRVSVPERVLGAWAMAVGFAMTAYPAWRYNAHDGSAAILDSIGSAVGVEVHRLFPSGSAVGFLLAAVYLAGFLWASWLGIGGKRSRHRGGDGEGTLDPLTP